MSSLSKPLASILYAILLCVALQDVLFAERELQSKFNEHAQPFLEQYCYECHSEDNRESGIRVDHLDGSIDGRVPFLLQNLLKVVEAEHMPPEDAEQPSRQERVRTIAWLEDALLAAKKRPRAKNGAVRRLTVAQYLNSLQDLLGIQEDYTSLLPPDAGSKSGFLNQEQFMVLSPLLLESYWTVAERALDAALVDESERPTIQRFRVDLGRSINPRPCPDSLILGANSRLLRNEDFTVTQLRADRNFPFQPFWMRTKYQFIEGYQGNATVRGLRHFDSIYHSVFACVRGTGGYPKGNAYDLVPEGLLLRPAVPSSLLFGKSSTYGPQANFKIALRELPDHGNFRVIVRAARYNDGQLLGRSTSPASDGDTVEVDLANTGEANVDLATDGIYQIDIVSQQIKERKPVAITLGNRDFTGSILAGSAGEDGLVATAFLRVRLAPGIQRLTLRSKVSDKIRAMRISHLPPDSPEAVAFRTFEARRPTLGVYLGLRRDCGHTLAAVDQRYRVSSEDVRAFTFHGAINNFPRPEVEDDNVNYLAGVREIGVRQEYTDGRDMPRLLVQSVEFEGPYYESWPPASHRQVFVESHHPPQSPAYARELLDKFATRAFRRPVQPRELDRLVSVWRESFESSGDFQASIRDALLVTLTSPQFLFQIEVSDSPKGEPLDEYELASKLAYFLWNRPPDDELLQLAEQRSLNDHLNDQVTRMIADPRSQAFVQSFVSQWLSLDKLDVVDIDSEKFPKFTSTLRTHLRNEPVALFEHLLQNNLSIRHLVQSDFVMANEAVASYYDRGAACESGLDYVPVSHEQGHLGGLLSQAGILAALSDGREPNPVKRGAWLARKIIAEPPDDPPPNVPELTADDPSLTLRQRLELHRNQPGCAKCHEGIDPWGLPLEEYDAAGRFRVKGETKPIESQSTLPDETIVANTQELKQYLAEERLDQVALSVVTHLATYATGRDLSYNEIEYFREATLQYADDGFLLQDLLRLVISSPTFLEK